MMIIQGGKIERESTNGQSAELREHTKEEVTSFKRACGRYQLADCKYRILTRHMHK